MDGHVGPHYFLFSGLLDDMAETSHETEWEGRKGAK